MPMFNRIHSNKEKHKDQQKHTKNKEKNIAANAPRRLVKARCENRTLAAFVLSLDDGEQMLAENVGPAGWLLGSLHLLTG